MLFHSWTLGGCVGGIEGWLTTWEEHMTSIFQQPHPWGQTVRRKCIINWALFHCVHCSFISMSATSRKRSIHIAETRTCVNNHANMFWKQLSSNKCYFFIIWTQLLGWGEGGHLSRSYFLSPTEYTCWTMVTFIHRACYKGALNLKISTTGNPWKHMLKHTGPPTPHLTSPGPTTHCKQLASQIFY